MESVNQIKSIVKSIFDCDTIPPEPNIFSPGFPWEVEAHSLPRVRFYPPHSPRFSPARKSPELKIRSGLKTV